MMPRTVTAALEYRLNLGRESLWYAGGHHSVPTTWGTTSTCPKWDLVRRASPAGSMKTDNLGRRPTTLTIASRTNPV
jgi:hypothetical protein